MLACVDAMVTYGAALRASREAFTRYSDACMARDDDLARVLDVERQRASAAAEEAHRALARVLVGEGVERNEKNRNRLFSPSRDVPGGRKLGLMRHLKWTS